MDHTIVMLKMVCSLFDIQGEKDCSPSLYLVHFPLALSDIWLKTNLILCGVMVVVWCLVTNPNSTLGLLCITVGVSNTDKGFVKTIIINI